MYAKICTCEYDGGGRVGPICRACLDHERAVRRRDPDWVQLMRRMRDQLYVVAMEDGDMDSKAAAASLAEEADAMLNPYDASRALAG